MRALVTQIQVAGALDIGLAEAAVQTAIEVVSMQGSRGFMPLPAHRYGYDKAVGIGYLKAPTRGYGYRLTPSGKALVAHLAAKKAASDAALVAAGFDPNKRLVDMTEAEVEAFAAFHAAKRAAS